MQVPVSVLASDREVVCTTPHWEIRPYGAVSERVLVRLSTDGVGTARSSQAYVNFVAYPAPQTVEPIEGPVEGGTMVLVHGQHFRPHGQELFIRCIFGTRKSQALILSDTELQCTSPPVDGAYLPTGYLAPFDLETVPAPAIMKGTTPAASQFPKKQLTFYYRRFIPSISWVEPLSGPEFGSTLVSLRSDAPILNSKNLKCVFGNIQVPLFLVTQNEATCTSPPVVQPGVVELTLTADGQNRKQIGPSGDAVRFKYYVTPTVAKVTPAFGSSRGGTIVQLEGAHFINDVRLTCKFGEVMVPAGFTANLAVGHPVDFPPVRGVYCRNASVRRYHPDKDIARIRCRFGTLTVPGIRVNETFLECVSPAASGSDGILQVDPPLGPNHRSLSIRLIGEGFISTNYLKVRFGGVSIEAEGQHLVQTALASTDTEAVVELPRLSVHTDMTRVPLYISNNGQNYAPEGVLQWDQDEDAYDVPKSMAYFTFHESILLRNVDPEVGMTYGGGFVSVFGYGFLNSTGLNCSFEWIGSPSVVYISSTQIMCEVPNMLAARSSKALGHATLRVTLNNRDWSQTSLSFRFLGECPIGHYCQHKAFNDYTFRLLPCPAGHFCESAGMSSPTPCPPGAFMPYRRQVQCQLCPIGFWCPRSRMIQPIGCRRGWVCDEPGLVVPYKRCPAGYYCAQLSALQ
ncbi:unnamed protein product [Symbiodinium pilosum]|uniref:IPT/TIG domain-containing protein n=1 Tax=Symbiodinium pilosum TaxID=2952 RepID=A0A812WJA2_SYMPI|nr:unnamed protein product [Symbiodinium pilosum]